MLAYTSMSSVAWEEVEFDHAPVMSSSRNYRGSSRSGSGSSSSGPPSQLRGVLHRCGARHNSPSRMQQP